MFQHGGHLTKDIYGRNPGGPLGGGGVPETITDDFSADSGLWLDGNLAPAAITISSGRGIWTPGTTSAGVLNPTMETGDPPSNWSSLNDATLTREADEHTGGTGSYALGVARGGANNSPYASQNSTLTAGMWYLRQGWRRNVDATRARWGLYDLTKPGYVEHDDVGVTGTTWNSWQSVFVAENANHLIQLIAETTGAGQKVHFDDVVIYLLVHASLIRWQRIYYVSELSAKVWQSVRTSAGLIVGKDINNYIMVRLSGSAAAVNAAGIRKRVAGTLSASLGSGAITYSAGTALKLTPTAAFTEFDVSYGAGEVISNVAINDFAADVDANGKFLVPYYAGLFNTFNSGSINSDAFDDFSAVRINP